MNIIIEKFKTVDYYLLTVMFLMILLSFVLEVEANVTVSPTRLILENGERSATVKLINPDNETAVYRISFVNMEMTEGGDFDEVAASDNREERLANYLAQDLIRYSPRQVSLPPKQAQLVRLQVMLPADLEDGEYRSHILFQEIPNQIQEENENGEETGINISLRAIYGVSIPVIIRHGETQADVKISDLNLKRDSENRISELSLAIKRSGNQSVYGDIEVTFSPDEGEIRLVGAVRGTAIYTDIETREYNVNLNPDDFILQNGILKVVYKQTAAEGGKILAENELNL